VRPKISLTFAPGGLVVAVIRIVLAGFIGLFSCLAWAAQPPELRLSADAPRLNLTLHMAAQRLPATTALNPDQAWDGAPDQPLLEPSPRWQSSPGMRLVGRVVLQGAGAEGTYVVHVPTAWFD
jgi:hypothetical protein